MSTAKNSFLTILCLFFTIACSSSDDDFDSICGTVIEDELFNPISEEFAEDVTIRTSSEGNLLVLENTDGEIFLIQLQGIAPVMGANRREAVADFIRDKGSQAKLFIADRSCFEDQGESDNLLPGQIFFQAGMSIGEELLLEGLVQAEVDEDSCGSNLKLNCLQGLQISAQDG